MIVLLVQIAITIKEILAICLKQLTVFNLDSKVNIIGLERTSLSLHQQILSTIVLLQLGMLLCLRSQR